MAWLFDSHIHLSDSTYSSDIEYTVRAMEHMKIKACCVSTDNENSLQTLRLAEKSDLILPFVGIHPERANDSLDQMTALIEKSHRDISGIGEIGLDPTYGNGNRVQMRIFEALLSLAEKFDKPVSIHSRKSLDGVLETMSSYDAGHALLHWFDGSKRQLRKAMDMGFFVSYGPVTVYAGDKQVLLSKTDESRILVETDGPVRFSRCFEMKSGQISFIPSVVFCTSKVLGKTFDETASLLEANSNAYLGI